MLPFYKRKLKRFFASVAHTAANFTEISTSVNYIVDVDNGFQQHLVLSSYPQVLCLFFTFLARRFKASVTIMHRSCFCTKED